MTSFSKIARWKMICIGVATLFSVSLSVVSHATEARSAYEPIAAGDAAVLFVFGQSNSVGYSTEYNKTRYTAGVHSKVYVARSSNTKVRSTELMEFSEYNPGHTDNILGKDAKSGKSPESSDANDNPLSNTPLYIADWWQKNSSKLKLPPLYIVHLAVGAQSINCHTSECRNGIAYSHDQWSIAVTSKAADFVLLAENKGMSPASATEYSLYNSARSLISRTIYTLQKQNMRPRILGIDWNQWESDSGTSKAAKVYGENLKKLIDGFQEAASGGNPSMDSIPVWLYYPLRQTVQSQAELDNMSTIEAAVTKVANDDPRFSIIKIHAVPNGYDSYTDLYVNTTTKSFPKKLRVDGGLFVNAKHYQSFAMRRMAIAIVSDIFIKNADGKSRFGVIPPALSASDLLQ
ncbi:MAG: hypothetical protein QE265_10270 [Rhodoferax sp.]|nr:hypothetical protein [Rhodoferax sp.]